MIPRLRSADFARRQIFANGAIGLGVPALASLLAKDLSAGNAAIQQRPKQFGGLSDLPHHPPKVKSVIDLLQNGAPPQVDTFDDKPQMEKLRGQELPESVHKNQRLSTMTQGQKSKPCCRRSRRSSRRVRTVAERLPAAHGDDCGRGDVH